MSKEVKNTDRSTSDTQKGYRRRKTTLSSTSQRQLQPLDPSLFDSEKNQGPQRRKSDASEQNEPQRLDISDGQEESSCSTENHIGAHKRKKKSLAKRKEISLEDKISILNFADKYSERETAIAFGISKTAVHEIKRNEQLLLALSKVSRSTETSRCRVIRKTEVEHANHKTWKWFLRRMKAGDHVTNKDLQERAYAYAHIAGVVNFSASNGWLYCFKKRFGITVCRSKNAVKNPKSVCTYLEIKEGMNNESQLSSDSETDEDTEKYSFKVPKNWKTKLKTLKPKPPKLVRGLEEQLAF